MDHIQFDMSEWTRIIFLFVLFLWMERGFKLSDDICIGLKKLRWTIPRNSWHQNSSKSSLNENHATPLHSRFMHACRPKASSNVLLYAFFFCMRKITHYKIINLHHGRRRHLVQRPLASPYTELDKSYHKQFPEHLPSRKQGRKRSSSF